MTDLLCFHSEWLHFKHTHAICKIDYINFIDKHY
jgi:hypothetical protein